MSRIRPLSSQINPRAGSPVIFKFDFPEGFTLIKDTREKNEHFIKPPKNLVLTRSTLNVGDYSIRGFENEIVVEYKSVGNLFSAMFANWESEEKSKMDRLMKVPWRWLLVGGTEEEVLSYPELGRTHPNQMRWRLAGSLEVRRGIPIHYEPDQQKRERWILDRLVFFYKMKRGMVHP